MIPQEPPDEEDTALPRRRIWESRPRRKSSSQRWNNFFTCSDRTCNERVVQTSANVSQFHEKRSYDWRVGCSKARNISAMFIVVFRYSSMSMSSDSGDKLGNVSNRFAVLHVSSTFCFDNLTDSLIIPIQSIWRTFRYKKIVADNDSYNEHPIWTKRSA